MKSLVHPKYKTKYRVSNWASYDRALVRRGNITLWLSPEAVAAWKPAGGGKRGGQRKYSDLAIETALTLRFSSTRYSIVRCCSRLTQPETVSSKARSGK